MEDQIKQLLDREQPLKAKDIASKLGVERERVSALLHARKAQFEKDNQHRWYLKDQMLTVHLPDQQWLTTSQFETTLSADDSPLDSGHSLILFQFGQQTSLLIDTIARLLALCNQLIAAGKDVVLDLSDCRSTRTYLDRVGFFEHLDAEVRVFPRRPSTSSASVHRNNSDTMVEVVAINLDQRDDAILKNLRDRFECVIDIEHYVRANTILGELFDNIHEHSSSPIPGFAALQTYVKGRKPSIRTVFSDSGAGIVGTLMPTLSREQLDEIRNSEKDLRVALIERIFSHGKLSRLNTSNQGRGLGLKRAGDLANKLNSNVNGSITVRQDTFEVTIHLHSDRITFAHRLNLHKLLGTHICFHMFLTN
ncbi:hypothetical protein J2X56_005268 [Herbaspirillum sp. 1173]|uniref:hypothetical protein n=1 Tax=Herbaspirillum sp. 1173 TaxID=2817734 RepID=UPI00285A3785|nr:hypothetical protein [Herbaspirillum sp. 1173]MDR6743231.1 hypothetical protein [Herbaspirillum sp. 1173]